MFVVPVLAGTRLSSPCCTGEITKLRAKSLNGLVGCAANKTHKLVLDMRTSECQRRLRNQDAGLTLIELVVVLAILVALGGLVVPRLISTTNRAQESVNRTSAVEIRDAAMRFWSDCKYAYPTTNTQDQRIQLGHLLQQPSFISAFDPNVGLGWNGPYLQSDGRGYTIDLASGFNASYGDTSQAAIRDTFTSQDFDGDGNIDSGLPFVLQEPTLRDLESASQTYSIGQPREIRVVSAGPNGVLDIDERRFAVELESNPSLQGDDIYVSFVLR